MDEITTEAEWLACVDPLAVGKFGRDRFDPQRFRHLAVSWGLQVREWLEDYNAAWFDAYVVWMRGVGDHPSTRPEPPGYARFSTHISHMDWADFFADSLRRNNLMDASVYAGKSASMYMPPPTSGGSCLVWDVWKVQTQRTGKQFCDEFRDVAGNPFRPVAVRPEWLTSTVTDLTRSIDASGQYGLLPVLADALEDAGCDSGELLTHCRGPGPHVRGCWAIDTALGRV